MNDSPMRRALRRREAAILRRHGWLDVRVAEQAIRELCDDLAIRLEAARQAEFRRGMDCGWNDACSIESNRAAAATINDPVPFIAAFQDAPTPEVV